MEKLERNVGGRPTKWTPELNDRLIEFFSVEPWTGSGKDRTPNKVPFFSRFEIQENLYIGILGKWEADEECEAKRPGFSLAYNTAKQLQKEFLVQNGVSGLFNPAFTIFTAKNITDMRDQTGVDLTSKGQFVGATINIHKPDGQIETTGDKL